MSMRSCLAPIDVALQPETDLTSIKQADRNESFSLAYLLGLSLLL